MLLKWDRRADRVSDGGWSDERRGRGLGQRKGVGGTGDLDESGREGTRGGAVRDQTPTAERGGRRGIQVGAAEMDDAGLGAGRHAVMAARMARRPVLGVARVALPRTRGHHAARGRDQREARGGNRGAERADQRFEHSSPG